MIMNRGECEGVVSDCVDEGTESEYPNSENCNCSLCTGSYVLDSESDGSDVDEYDCVGFGNSIVSEHE